MEEDIVADEYAESLNYLRARYWAKILSGALIFLSMLVFFTTSLPFKWRGVISGTIFFAGSVIFLLILVGDFFYKNSLALKELLETDNSDHLTVFEERK